MSFCAAVSSCAPTTLYRGLFWSLRAYRSKACASTQHATVIAHSLAHYQRSAPGRQHSQPEWRKDALSWHG
eukprot:11089102-Heterocapsa_arctica.AAC.1